MEPITIILIGLVLFTIGLKVVLLLCKKLIICKKCGRLQERGWVMNVEGKWKRYWNCPKCDGATYKL